MQTGSSDQVSGRDHTTAWDPPTRVVQMRVALDSVLAIGPGFLDGDVDADTMANTMVHVASENLGIEPLGSDATQAGEAHELHAAMIELLTCGSGYLAGRCDADCVVRTMTQMVSELGASKS